MYETLRTLHIWKLESTRSSRMLQCLSLPFIPKWFEHLPPTLLLHCLPLAFLLLPQAWWTSVSLWVLLQNVAFQFHNLHIVTDLSPWLYSAISSNGYTLEFIMTQNCPPPKSLHSVFSLSGHHLCSLGILLWLSQLFFDCIRTSSPLAHLHYPFSSVLSYLHIIRLWILGPSFQSGSYLYSQLPLPLVLLLYSWVRTILPTVHSLQAAKRILRKSMRSGRLQFMITYLNWAQHCLHVYHVSLESFAFHISASIISIFVSLLKPSCILSFLFTLFRENRSHLMETTWTSCQQIFKPTCFVPTVPTSFLLLFNEGVPLHLKSHPFLYLHPTPSCLLRKWSSSVLFHWSILNFFFSCVDPVSCNPLFHLPFNVWPIYLPSPATPLHSSW